MGKRIKDVSISDQPEFIDTIRVLVDQRDADAEFPWLQAKSMQLKYLGNTYFAGSINNRNFHDKIVASDTYIRFSTDGGTNWIDLSTKNVREDTNLYFTPQRVLAIDEIADTLDQVHEHTNFTLLESIKDTGDGTEVLTDDGTYQSATTIFETLVIPTIDSLDFSLTPAGDANVIGRLQWSEDEKTLQFGVEGGTIDINKEMFDYYHDSSIAGLVEGDVVSVVGINGNRQAVNLTNATSEALSTACIGIVTNVNENNTVRVTKKGRIRGLNTQGLTEGMPVYVNFANPGKLTQTAPEAPNYFIHVGIVEVAHLTQGIIDIDIRVSPKVQNLSDVNGTALTTTGQLLVWDNATSKFDFIQVYGKFGDVAGGNYAEFEADGTLKFNGTATTFDDITFDAMNIKATGPGISVNTTELTVDFTSTADDADFLYVNVQLPHARKLTSKIYPHIHWNQAQNAVPNFAIEYRWQVNLEDKTTAWTPLKMNTPVDAYVSGTKNQICGTVAGITPPAGDKISDVIQFKIYRDTQNDLGLSYTADLYTGTVSVMQFDCHIEKDSNGSREEYVR
jgi:hypothetical protein